MSYTVRFRPQAEEDLARLVKSDHMVAQRILAKIKWLAQHCDLISHESLTGEAGYYKRRVGDYRVIYMVNGHDQCVDICLIGNRKDIYDRL